MDNFECIMAIAEYGNISKASEHIYMTQPALSLRLTRLEDSLGIKIFDRSSHPLKLTREGSLYIHEMRKIKAMEEKMKSDLLLMSLEKKKTITIGIGFNRGRAWLPELLPFLLRTFPDYHFQVREAADSEIEQLIRQGAIDIGILGSKMLLPDIYSLPLAKEQLYIGVPAQNQMFASTDTSAYSCEKPYILKDASIIEGQTLLIGSSSYGIARFANKLFDTYHIRPRQTINIANGETSYLLTAKGVGISFLFSHYWNTPLTGKELRRPVPCCIENIILERTVTLNCRQEDKNSEYIMTVTNAVADWYAKEYQEGQ